MRGRAGARRPLARREPGAARGGGAPARDDAEDFFAAFGAPPRPLIPGAPPRRLLRREALMTGRDAFDAASATAFLDDVASLAFRFHDGTDWVAAWDSEDRANYRPLPRAVAIDLGLYDATGEIRHFTTAVDLALADTRPGPRRSPDAGRPTPAAAARPKATGARTGAP